MSKYDFDLDLSEKTSTGMIIGEIKPNSIVLEFGCATGRMTRYMKEQLNCKVYIVEIEQAAFDQACLYAEDGVCGDVLAFEWIDKFQAIRFDYILFTDVLEHLTNPKLALSKATSFLNDNGKIIASLPNITHNDILLKEISDEFNYTNVGLLDNTHVHFWGLHNIKKFAEESGLHLNRLRATYCKTGATEQFAGEDLETTPYILNILENRKCGNIYQFVIEMSLYCEDEIIELKECAVDSQIYLDFGDGFSEKNVIKSQSYSCGENKYKAIMKINNLENVKTLRFDPIEGQSCILCDIKISQGNKALNCKYLQSTLIENGVLLRGTDPMVIIELDNNEECVIVEAIIIVASQPYVELLQKALLDMEMEKTNLIQEIDEIYRRKNKVKSCIQKLLPLKIGRTEWRNRLK